MRKISCHAVVLAMLALSRASWATAQAPRCTDPAPQRPDWWHIDWIPQSDGSSRGDGPTMPRLPEDTDPRQLAGRYQMTVVLTAGGRPGLTTRGVLDVRPVGESGGTWQPVLIGATDSAFAFPAGGSIAHPTFLTAVDTPGVQAFFRAAAGELTLIFGNSRDRTDSGVLFDVFQADSTRLVGRWVDGGLGVRVNTAPGEIGGIAQGYFCFDRLRD